MIAKLNKE